jgi:8-oxo-dGTP pyrophosphatase MutT (NUDIX family)
LARNDHLIREYLSSGIIKMVARKKVQRAGCIVCYKNQILLVHQKESNFWGFPKGRLNKRERDFLNNSDSENTYKKCAIRELYEEAGVKAKENELGNCIRYNEVRFYILNCEEKPSVKIDNFEIDDHIWIDRVKMPCFNISSPTRFVYKKIRNIV